MLEQVIVGAAPTDPVTADWLTKGLSTLAISEAGAMTKDAVQK